MSVDKRVGAPTTAAEKGRETEPPELRDEHRAAELAEVDRAYASKVLYVASKERQESLLVRARFVGTRFVLGLQALGGERRRLARRSVSSGLSLGSVRAEAMPPREGVAACGEGVGRGPWKAVV